MSEPWKPHAYQKHMVSFGVGRACAGFFVDPGLGKTSVIYAIFKVLRRKCGVKRMLVVAPLRPAQSVWPAEAQKWTDFNDLKIRVLHGNEKSLEPADVYVINPEGLPWLTRTVRDPEWYDMLVIDESTRFKHSNTQRFKTLKVILPFFKRRYILTGSPAPNGLLDLFGQIYILDMGHTLGAFISHYKTNYFQNPGTGPFDKYKWLPRPGAPEEIQNKLKPLVLRLAGEDHLDLPPLLYNRVEVTLPDDARKVYDQMESLLLASVGQGIITAANAAAATTKCRQIANGGIYHEDGEKWTHLHEAKLDATEEIIEELSGKPALVAFEYKHDLERLLRRFGSDTPYIGGGVSANRFRDIERAWNAGRVPILLAQPQSVAHGLNLMGTAASVIWHSLTWDLEVSEQFVRRVWRQGQKETVIVHNIVAKNTVDEVIVKCLEQKDRTQRNMLTALKSYVSSRQPKK